MPPENTPVLEPASDAALVAACLDGSREAYGEIVARYQRLLCSLAYSATGSVSESEDLAQEAFIEGWRKLRNLREPDKLRGWLCGILRFKLGRLRRDDAREPTRGAQTLDAAGELASDDDCIAGQAMREEETSLLWRTLERVPETYREPLILYYREHRSVEHVADALGLSEDAVKQRLSRGRKLLQERMMGFVESALARSSPGRVFTLGVLAALPEMAAPAKAAAIGAAAAQGTAMAKSTTAAALLASLAGVVNFVVSLRAALDQTRTPRERRVVVRSASAIFLGCLAALFVLYGLREAAFRWWEARAAFAYAAQATLLGFVVAFPFAVQRMLRAFRRMRSEERRARPECFAEERDRLGSAAGEYRSRARLLGAPLVHIRFAMAEEGSRPVFGWIACGDRACGLLFAWGNLTIAPISVGTVSVGLLSCGALGFGVVSLGTFAVGALAIGCATIGVKAYAWLAALGWETATSGGFGVARLAAEAPVAFARHANDPIARQILEDPNAARNQMIFFATIAVCSLVPLALYARALRRRLGGRAPRR